MPVVLLDTNVWVSALINPHGYPAQIVAAWAAGKIQVVVSAALLTEVAEVLARPRIRNKYGVTEQESSEFRHLLTEQGILVNPTGVLHVCRDPDDDLILEAAMLGQAQYVVSRDDDLKADQELVNVMAAYGVTILSVQQFLTRLADESL